MAYPWSSFVYYLAALQHSAETAGGALEPLVIARNGVYGEFVAVGQALGYGRGGPSGVS